MESASLPMNSGGATAEAGLTARGAIEALKSTPVLLAILIFNLAFMVMLGWGSHEQGERWEAVVGQAFKYCQDFNERQRGMRLQSEESRPIDLDNLPPIP